MAPPDVHSDEYLGFGAEQRTCGPGGWRSAFLGRGAAPSSPRTRRPLRISALEGRDGGGVGSGEGSSTARELRPQTDPQSASETNSFSNHHVIAKDLELIEQLTQKMEQRPAGRVRKPKPPPRPSPYRSLASTQSTSGAGEVQEMGSGLSSTLSEAAGVEESAPAAGAPVTASDSDVLNNAGPEQTLRPHPVEPAPSVAPVVPSSGHLFSGNDIDCLFDRMQRGERFGPQSPSRSIGAGGLVMSHSQPSEPLMVNMTGLHGSMHAVTLPPSVQSAAEATKAAAVGDSNPPDDSCSVPCREGLKAHLRAIDSWLEEDFSARDRMHGKYDAMKSHARGSASVPFDPEVHNLSLDGLLRKAEGADDEGATMAKVFNVLKDIRARKSWGENADQTVLRELADQAKLLIPGLSLRDLVIALKLFASARYEDYDLYLRILGEIPLQIKDATTDLVVTLSSALRRLRLREHTYLELLSMEAMNMIRAQHKPAPRTARKPGIPRSEERLTNPMPSPTVSPSDPPMPFNSEQLIRMGNALSILDTKHTTRFLDIFQDQLLRALPLLTSEQCEMVHPTFALGPLVNDKARRVFLEQCANTGAGQPIPHPGIGDKARDVVPDIMSFRDEAARRRWRLKHISNVYVIEACVRKEHFSFFSSLPANVKSYLDALHADACHLSVDPPSKLTSQVADVLHQLGVKFEVGKKVGPICLHIAAQGAKSGEFREVAYECCDVEDFYAPRMSERGPETPELTAMARLRHRLLDRLGVRLTHISIWEWRTLSEAQRINYMVKLQSLQES